MKRQWINTRRKTITDFLDEGRETVHHYSRLMAREKSRVQEIILPNLKRFGPSLWLRVLKGEDVPGIQFDWAHEHRYHQLFAYVMLIAHPAPRRLGLFGGGDMPLVLRTLTHKGVRQAEIFDWDHRVGELVLQHCDWIRRLYKGRDKKKQLIIPGEVDVRELLPNAEPEAYDGLFGDLIDMGNLDAFIPGFLEYSYRMLKPGGFFATQAGSGSLAPQDAMKLAEGIHAFRKTFMGHGRKGSVWLWTWPIESFSYPQVWLAGWKGVDVAPPVAITKRDIARHFDLSRWRLDRPFFSPEVCRAAFTIPEDLAKAVCWK